MVPLKEDAGGEATRRHDDKAGEDEGEGDDCLMQAKVKSVGPPAKTCEGAVGAWVQPVMNPEGYDYLCPTRD